MARGTWITMNMTRPGAYINFRSIPKPVSLMGTRGVVLFPLALSWGDEDEIIEVTPQELVSGTSVKKIGLTINDAGAKLFRLAFLHAAKALVYRLDKGGNKATATIATDVTATAAHGGVKGNIISVTLDDMTGGNFRIKTLYNGAVKDTQIIAAAADFKANGWITLSGTGALAVSAGVTLAGGTDGTVDAASWTSYFTAAAETNFNTLAVPTADPTQSAAAADLVKTLRDTKGKVQAVVVDYAEADHEGVISIDQAADVNGETLTPAEFTVYVAALTAGATLVQSNSYFAIEGATTIVNPKTDAEIIEALQSGKMVLSKRSDGAIVIEQDINTLQTFTVDKDENFAKNRIVRTLDDIATQTAETWEVYYIGKKSNTPSGRAEFRADIIKYCGELNRIGAIENFAAEDVTVEAGAAPTEVVVTLGIKVVDAMEKLYMTVNIRS